MDVPVEHVLLSLFLIHIASSRVHRFVIFCRIRVRFDKDTSRHVFLSQFPTARKFIVEIVKHFSNGWAQGFVFTFSKDIELAWEEEGDDTVIKDLFAEVIEIIARAYGARADIQSRAPYCLTSEADHAYGKLHNMLMQCRRDRSLFAADVHSHFSKFGYWGPSYTFAVHAMREALRYGKFRRGPEWSNAEPEYKPRGSTTSIPDTIPNLLSPTYQGRWACMSPDAIVHTVFLLSSSCNWVCKCWCQRLATLRSLGPPREWLRHICQPIKN